MDSILEEMKSHFVYSRKQCLLRLIRLQLLRPAELTQKAKTNSFSTRTPITENIKNPLQRQWENCSDCLHASWLVS
jgi:hypothetical protein